MRGLRAWLPLSIARLFIRFHEGHNSPCVNRCACEHVSMCVRKGDVPWQTCKTSEAHTQKHEERMRFEQSRRNRIAVRCLVGRAHPHVQKILSPFKHLVASHVRDWPGGKQTCQGREGHAKGQKKARRSSEQRHWSIRPHQSSRQDSAFVTVLPPFSAKFCPTLQNAQRNVKKSTSMDRGICDDCEIFL